MQIKIVYEDRQVLVIYKPAGLATQTAQAGRPDVVSECKNYLKGAYVGVVHRLDQPVEGLLVFAKTRQAAAKLSDQLKSGTLNKQYQAVVCGQPLDKEGTLVDYLYKTADNRAAIAKPRTAAWETARKAVLHYVIRKDHNDSGVPGSVEPQKICLVDITIETGRFHQIRCQMAHAGMPLLGDQKYQTSESAKISNLLQVRNVALCAVSLEFVHPDTGRLMHFTAEPEAQIFDSFGAR